MTERLIIQHIPDRLAQPHRPKSIVLSDPADRIKGTKRQQHRPILGQPRLRNAETATFNLKNNASAASSRPTRNVLSP